MGVQPQKSGEIDVLYPDFPLQKGFAIGDLYPESFASSNATCRLFLAHRGGNCIPSARTLVRPSPSLACQMAKHAADSDHRPTAMRCPCTSKAKRGPKRGANAEVLRPAPLVHPFPYRAVTPPLDVFHTKAVCRRSLNWGLPAFASTHGVCYEYKRGSLACVPVNEISKLLGIDGRKTREISYT